LFAEGVKLSVEKRCQKRQHYSDMRTRVYLSLGSNIGDRPAHLKQAIGLLGRLGTIVAVSSFYETEPVENTEQPWFLNCAVAFETDKTPKQLLSAALKIEREMGRTRSRQLWKGPRIIDIDIIFFGDAVIHSTGLAIPHPAMQQRRFVLEPLAEIAPDVRHPVLKQTAREMRDALPQSPAVRKLVDGP
jgi:2-amino-4-hydroxy-6-hydroxymethyldihydropteridine diphosphokinase